MATKTFGRDDNPFDWTPRAVALWTRRQTDPQDAHPTFILLRHPASPFPRIAFETGTDTLDITSLQTFVFAYLRAADKTAVLGLPPKWLQALDPADPNNRQKASFAWMEIEWPPRQHSEKASANPLVSYRVGRQRGDGPVLPDQILVLVASERFDGKFLGSDFGLRVVLHARQLGAGGYQLRITGMTAVLPFGIFLTDGVTSQRWSEKDSDNLVNGEFLKFERHRDKAGNSSALALDKVFFCGVRVARNPDNSLLIEKRGTGLAAAAPGVSKPTPYAFVFRDDISAAGTPAGAPRHIRKVALVADANVRLFKIDPASQGTATGMRNRRVTRSEAQLDTFRTLETIEPNSMDPLVFPQPPASAEMEVRLSPLLEADRGGLSGAPKTVVLAGSGPAVRSNDFAAVNALYNVENIFKRLEAYGINVQNYFRLARLPLKVVYRSGIRPGPGKDGNTINARVFPDGWGADFTGPPLQGDRPALELQLALANLSHRARAPWDGKARSPAEPLGIAADARLIWHEFGHVLLMASVGELEFRFAHSAGDALAAIASDPYSQLAADPVWRGETFPWVFIPRRHDRNVLLGWSWGGTLHHDLAQVPDSWLPRMKSYWSEQILSSSLFRLYLCLGGDTPPAKTAGLPASPMREKASHYSIYLIAQAIALMGGLAPANDPDYFITSLIDADIASNPWEAIFVPADGPAFMRVGGCAWKVIRWAFEAQGMYAKPGTVTNAPGLAPDIDIYIADRRPLVDATAAGAIDYGPGNYAPVSLEWDAKQLGADVPPLWQAGADAIKVQGKNITVSVGNRGSATAAQVTVAVWQRAWPAGDPQPDWNDASASWTACVQTSVASASVNAGEPPVDFTFTHSPPATRYILFAAATCADDPANTDAATGFPCSYQPTPLVDLVSGDNNLGLLVLG